ncbi:hypothetical protein FHR72_001942 [Mycolicibacterium iranicum]|uniref:Uncharacterized protein n=1 Tax=Mycolicibacterium iranicum TaxID=912594 RepID=A0A839Q6G6_MYCIR|nr:hypothetical protein [Mycolicibacterium iranicum]MBB2990474.1 hypothetical protein [Mycolicibacterium iranicum]
MTALQDWIGINPVDAVTGAIRDVWRELTSGEAEQTVEEPQLMGRGLERC